MGLADDLNTDLELEELRRVHDRTLRQLSRTKNKIEDLVEAVQQGARDAVYGLGGFKPVAAPKLGRVRSGSPEVAVPDLGDWQGAKVTPSYNSRVMVDRVGLFWDKAAKVTEIMRRDHPVDSATVLFGGDMVEGLFNFPTQAHEVDATIFQQWAQVSRLLIESIRRALALYPEVTVVAEWGNHGRIGSKRDGVPRHDNIDRMCYEHARQMLADQPRLHWQDCPEDIQRVEIGNYRALLIHGDEIGRNGFSSRASIIQHVNRWRSGAYPWEFRDVYVHHYHTHYQEAMANGQGTVFGTGSTESDNRYAREQLAASAVPSQRLNFVDPDRGRVTYPCQIWLDG
jgi:hypothetical protein